MGKTIDSLNKNLQQTLDLSAYSQTNHTHKYAGSSSAGGAATSANKVNTNLAIKLNGGSTEGTNLFTFNGSTAKTINITPSNIGAAASSHTHSYLPLSGGTISSPDLNSFIIERTAGDGYGACIGFKNNRGLLGYILMMGDPDNGLVRMSAADTSKRWTILDQSNYKTYVTPSSIGAATSSSVGTLSSLQTSAKGNLVAAINELFQSANNGKQLIATAIGEPLSAEDTFSAMSNDINGLLATFKTNMMSNGVTVESSDKFKQLIDKIATMAEDNSGKGIHYAEGAIGDITFKSTEVSKFTIYNIPININFTPTVFFLEYTFHSNPNEGVMIINNVGNNIVSYGSVGTVDEDWSSFYIGNVSSTNCELYYKKGVNSAYKFTDVKYYAIGVGEEDTTLRDSLASILEDEGVNITEEDDMANLIAKTDEEFTKDNNTISELEEDAENTRSTLAGLMQEGGYSITGNESIDNLLDLLILSGISVTDIKQIACGHNHTFVLKTNGSLWSCGANNYSQLGLGNTTTYKLFTQVTTNINNDVKQVICGYNHTFIIKNNGTVWACGLNANGQLGLGDAANKKTFTQVSGMNNVKQITCGGTYTVILKNDGSVWGSGRNANGQLGLGDDTTNRTTFTQVTTNINSDVKQIACGNDFTVILKNDGSVWGSGSNYYGQLGLNASDDKKTFTQVPDISDAKQVICGQYHTFIIKSNDSVWSCGYNTNGQLGLGDYSNKTTFTQVTANVNNDVKQIASGYNLTVILKNDGSVWSCGYNTYGQLGMGDTTQRNTFTQVTTNINSDVNQIACGQYYTVILKNDGSVWGSGYNGNSQLGLGDTIQRTTFTNVPRGL